MSKVAQAAAGPFLPLPGFMPDAVPFASRFACALVLAYFVAFLFQLDTASSAGVCVAIVMQPAPGMTMSKAFYRIVGTVVGGVVALVLVSAFPQDRTMLLAAAALWMGICAYMATVLRDFRSYAAALSGYTVAIIDVIGIDSPNSALLSTLNRMAAILVGIASVALVNSLFVVETDQEKLEAGLKGQLEIQRRGAQDALAGRTALSDDAYLQQAADILALQTQATYAGAELGNGRRWNHAAESMIAAMLDMLAASRVISRILPPEGPSPATRAHLDAMSASIHSDRPPPLLDRLPSDPVDAVLVERASRVAGEHRRAQACLEAIATGATGSALPRVRLRRDPDRIAALLNAVRAVASFGLVTVFCVLGGVSSVSLLLVYTAALMTLLAAQPNPSKAVSGFMVALPVAALLAGTVNFLVLPLASGFVSFALAVAAAAFAVALMFRNKVTTKIGPALMLFLALLLGPSNVETFDLSSFLNEVLNIAIAVGFSFASFCLILPVQPGQQLFRAADKVAWSLRRTFRRGGPASRGESPSMSFDRLTQALLWVNARPGKRPVLVSRLCDFAALESALRRAWSGLRDAELDSVRFSEAIRMARTGLAIGEPDRLDQAARRLLAVAAPDGASSLAVLRAVSGLYESKLLLEQQRRALLSYGVLGG